MSSTSTPSCSAAPDPEAAETEVMLAFERHSAEMIAGLRGRGWWASEISVLPLALTCAMRSEVEALWSEGRFQRSQSVRGTTYYDKEHVYATEIDGSTYDVAPRLAHYTVTVARALTAHINAAFPAAQLSAEYIGNKLNMCLGQGAAFEPHLDVGVNEKPFDRKLTLLVYLNDHWRPELGGEITLLGRGATEDEAAQDSSRESHGLPAKIAPQSGRWVVFWADQMLHKVEASQSFLGLEDYRVSYTIWMCSADKLHD